MMEAPRKRILREHLFQQSEQARQELLIKEQHELMRSRLKNELINRLQLQNQKNHKQYPVEFNVPPVTAKYSLPVPPQQNNPFHQQQQFRSSEFKPKISAERITPITYPSPYDRYLPPSHRPIQVQVQQDPRSGQRQGTSSNNFRTHSPSSSSSSSRSSSTSPLASTIHGIDRTNHKYTNGEYFCVCGAQFPSKQHLFGHIREMCKNHGATISCNFSV